MAMRKLGLSMLLLILLMTPSGRAQEKSPAKAQSPARSAPASAWV